MWPAVPGTHHVETLQGGWLRPLQDEMLLEVGASSKDVRLSQKLM